MITSESTTLVVSLTSKLQNTDYLNNYNSVPGFPPGGDSIFALV